MVLGNSINLIEEWAKEFREHFGLTGEKISGDQWAELKKIEDSGLYEISNENIGQVNSGYTLSSIFVKNPKSSIIWSALEILLFGDYAKYDVQKDGSYTRELGQNRIKEIYDIFDSIFDAKCGRFTMIVSELYEKLNIDKDTFKNKNVFIDDAVYFLLRVFNRENIRTSNINTHNTIVMNSLRSNGILRDYNYMETIVEELFSKFDGLCEYKNQIDRILNVEVSTNEKVSFFNSKKRVSDYINSCVGFRSNVLNVFDVGFRNCAVSHRFMQAIGDVRSFTNSYFNTSIQYSEDKIELLNFKYSKRDCLEILNKCESINLQSDNKEIESAIEKLKGVARSLDDQIAEINEIVSYFEGETGSAAEKLLEDSRKLKAEFDDAVSNVKLKIGGLSKIIDKKEKEKRLQEINSEKQELEKRLKDLDNELKVMEQECEIISSRDKATLLVEKLDEHITFFKPYIDKTVEYYDEIVAKDIANKIDEVVKKLEEIKANAEIKAKDENLPRFYEEGTESLENGSKNITLKGENGNVKVNLQLLDEDFNELLFSENAPEELTRIRDYSAYHELVDAAVDVKRQPIFNYGDITKYPYFIPFKYQVDSVRTMLARFEVRGVYAEQVGLGKTIQALMTADVVFRCGAIDNVVIVASKTNIPQWRKEAEVKFREANGEQMFEIFPKLTAEEARKTGTTPSKDGFYNFRELNENIEKVKNFKGNSRKKRKLNVFFLSTNSLIDNGSGGIEEIKKSNEYYDLEQMANKPLEPNVKVVANDIINDNLAKPISEEKCIAKLFYMATVLYNRYINNVLPKDLNAFTEVILHGGEIVDDKNIKWDVDKKWEIVLSGATLDKTVDYNNKLEEIRNRIIQIKKDIAEGRKNSIYTKKRLIDLLIFDEVQDILIPNSKKANSRNATNAKIIQDFIAKLQKRYCILISATPIKNDLSDIFNLHYMVDKNKLGATREEAQKRFYTMYCNDCTSLSEMANRGKNEFKVLNGLINSMFTRKRLYDPDVKESMSRHTATPSEIEIAKKNNRNDYGGEKFVKLVEYLAKCHTAEIDDNLKDELLKYRRSTFPVKSYKITDENFIIAMVSLSKSVNMSVDFALNCLKLRLKGGVNFENDKINICERFVTCYRKLIETERNGGNTENFKKQCKILCNCINRGFLDFFRVKHQYSTTFLSDYIDWTRPVKRGIALECDTKDEMSELLANALIPADSEIVNNSILVSKNSNGKVNDDDLMELKTGKVLIFEKGGHGERSAFYRSLRKLQKEATEKGTCYGDERHVYVNVSDDDARNKYTEEELINLCYFKKSIYSKLAGKDKESLTKDEENYLNTWDEKGNLKTIRVEETSGIFEEKEEISKEAKTHRNYNFKSFSEFEVKDGRWNSVYMMDNNQREGTDLNAANILVINQLDKHRIGGEVDYLDPLEMEQLIGRISRVGQTEECLVYTFIYSENNEANKGFNKVYYDILADKKGFNLFGKCQTEVSFVVPVVMACMRRLFDKNYKDVNDENFKKDHSEFKAVYKNEYIPVPENVEKFPQMLKYLYDNRDEITIYYTELSEDGKPTGNERVYTGDQNIEAIKLMIQIYSEVLCHETEEDSKKD